MKKYIFLLLFFGLFSQVCVYAQDNSGIMSFDVKGIAAIRQSNVAGARKEAIQNALKAAILEATAKLMSISVEDERFQPVKSIIIHEPDKYIKIYKIIAEMEQPDSYEVNVNVVVTLISLEDALRKMGFLQIAQKEKIAPVISLKAIGKKYSDFSRLKEFLQNRENCEKYLSLPF